MDPHHLQADLLRIGRAWTIRSADADADENLQPDDYNWVQHGFASRDGWMHPNPVVHLVVLYVVQNVNSNYYKIGQTMTHERPVLARIMEQNAGKNLKLVGLAVCAQRRRDTGASYQATRLNHDTAMRNDLLVQGLATKIAVGSEIEWVSFVNAPTAIQAIVQHCGRRGHAWLAPASTATQILQPQYISTRAGGDTATTTQDPAGAARIVARAVYVGRSADESGSDASSTSSSSSDAGSISNSDAGSISDGSIGNNSISSSDAGSSSSSIPGSQLTLSQFSNSTVAAGTFSPSQASTSTAATDTFSPSQAPTSTAATQSSPSKRPRSQSASSSDSASSASTSNSFVWPVPTLPRTLYGMLLHPRTGGAPGIQELDVITVRHVHSKSQPQDALLHDNEKQYLVGLFDNSTTTWVGIVFNPSTSGNDIAFDLLYRHSSGDAVFTHFPMARYDITVHGTVSQADFDRVFNRPSTRPDDSQSQDSGLALRLRLSPISNCDPSVATDRVCKCRLATTSWLR